MESEKRAFSSNPNTSLNAIFTIGVSGTYKAMGTTPEISGGGGYYTP